MSEINDILTLYDRVSRTSSKHALATVISTDGPSYRSAGARSLVVEDGTFRGGLSAGCLEGDIACRLDGVTTPFIVEYDLSTEDDIRGFPFGCGGLVRIYVEPLPNAEALRAIHWLAELHEPAVLLTVVAVKNGGFEDDEVCVGAHFGVTKSGSTLLPDIEDSPTLLSGCATLKQLTDKTFQNTKSALHQIEIDGLQLQVFAEYFEPAVSLCIFGDGEDAHALKTLADTVGLNVTRITRHQIRTSVALVEEIQALHSSYVVVMTHDLTLDSKVLEQLIAIMPPYLGVMGPRSRTEKILTTLGIDVQSTFSHPHFYAPVGLNIAAETPQEIALSILAEVKSVAHKCEPDHLRNLSGAIHERSHQTGSKEIAVRA